MRREFFIFAGVFFVAAVVFSFIYFTNKDEIIGLTENKILIGSSSALSGHTGFLGTEVDRGARAYINEVNQNGGINGRLIELISYDDQYDPPQTVENTKKLIDEDKVFTLFNYVGTPTSLSILSLVSNRQVPVVGLFTGSEYLRDPFQKYIFNVRPSYFQESEAIVEYFVDYLGFEDIAVFYQDDSFGLSGLKGVETALSKRNMDLLVADSYIRGTLGIEEALGNILLEEPDAIIMVGTYAPLAKFVKLSQDGGYNSYYHAISFVGSEEFSKELIETYNVDSESYDKIIVTQVVPSPNSIELPIVQEYQFLMDKYYPFNEFTYTSLEGFLNAKVLVYALNESGSDLTRESFINSLESMENVDVGIGHGITFTSTEHEGFETVHFSRLSSEGHFEEFEYI